jgi:hypothetical protein
LKIEVRPAPMLAALIISAPAILAQGLIETNEQIVISSVQEAVIESLRTETFGRMVIPLAQSGIERPVSVGIAGALRDMGVEVLADGAGGDSAKRLSYDVLGFDFSYRRGDSRGFLRKPMIKREFAAQLRITVKAPPNGRIVFLNEIGVEYNDNIAPGFVELARSRDIPELAPDPPGSGWIRFVEPAIVTGAVGALVYLFFANR